MLVGHSFGSLIARPRHRPHSRRIAHLVIIDGASRRMASRSSATSSEIVAKRRKLVKTVNGTEVLPFAPVGSLIIDDPALAAWTHRQLTPHPLACYASRSG